MQKVKLKNSKTQAGFTLLELAIVIIMSGLSMLMLTEFMRAYTINGQHARTLENTRMAQRALREFFVVQKRYPCPADPTLVPGDLEYGLEQCRIQADIDADPDGCIAGNYFTLACTTFASRDGDQNNQPDVVLIGILPFRTLYNEVVDTPFSESHRIDGYGAYLSYAVTEQMAYSWHDIDNPTNPHTGAIRVQDENGISVVTPDASAHYVLFSHGDNGRGGYTTAGVMIDDCLIPALNPSDPDVAAPPGPNAANIIIEKENCDNSDAIFVKGIRSLANNSNYYDDLLFFNKPGQTALWTHSLSSLVPPGESYIHNTNLGYVGIGLTNPAEQLHIDNDLSAEVNTIGVEYCGNGGNATTCVDPEMIAGDDGSICTQSNDPLNSGYNIADPTRVAYAIQNNRVVCRDVNWVIPTIPCDPNEYLVAFSNLGTPKCEPLSSP
ncbi:MAG: hypothetical protein COB36_06550 [Alphaproteobacteria bacterium]|nr:MAG: hypothetical protein COB36_06550 [Alphaproteobacteria bacterium]